MKANLKPGDEIVVRSGTYNEAVVVNKDGAAGNYITVRSEVPGGAKIVPPGDKPGININANYVDGRRLRRLRKHRIPASPASASTTSKWRTTSSTTMSPTASSSASATS